MQNPKLLDCEPLSVVEFLLPEERLMRLVPGDTLRILYRKDSGACSAVECHEVSTCGTSIGSSIETIDALGSPFSIGPFWRPAASPLSFEEITLRPLVISTLEAISLANHLDGPHAKPKATRL